MSILRDITIDHVTVAWSDLDEIGRAFSVLGFAPCYGGPHSNGQTHMSVVAFEDGSYIELISTLPGVQTDETVWWYPQMTSNRGVCAWAIQVKDIADETERLSRLGIVVDGPKSMSRRRPDGVTAAWNLTFVDPQRQPGAVLPFMIQDHTPRQHRIGGIERAHRDGLLGLDRVVIAVDTLGEFEGLFQQVYGWAEPIREDDDHWDAHVSHFENVSLVESRSKTSYVAKHISQHGPMVLAALIGVSDFHQVIKQFPIREMTTWYGRDVAWIDCAQAPSVILGLTSCTSQD